ncbi:MAG: universal stress protein [Deltaproteobacteria bacterium]|nr:universal stress protein [Deltaproteobacteria bacterium]
MFSSILVPLDLSDRNTEALRLAASLLAPGGRLTLLHVVELIPGLSREEEPAFYARLERAAHEQLGAHARTLEAEGCAPEVVIEAGRRVEVIVTQAADHALVVLASHRIDPSTPARSWGTLSYQIGLLAPASVLLVKSGEAQ